jgi:hypothetical protein
LSNLSKSVHIGENSQILTVSNKKKNGKILKDLGPVYRSELKYLIEIKINSLRDWLNFGEQPIRNLDFEFNRD